MAERSWHLNRTVANRDQNTGDCPIEPSRSRGRAVGGRRRRLLEVRPRELGDESYRSDEGRRQYGIVSGEQRGVFGHEVSQRGGGRGGDGERGDRPMSTMRPPHTGHRSMRWPVRIA